MGRVKSNTAGEVDAAMAGICSVFGTGTNAREDVLDGRSRECVQERAGRARSRDLFESSREQSHDAKYRAVWERSI